MHEFYFIGLRVPVILDIFYIHITRVYGSWDLYRYFEDNTTAAIAITTNIFYQKLPEHTLSTGVVLGG